MNIYYRILKNGVLRGLEYQDCTLRLICNSAIFEENRENIAGITENATSVIITLRNAGSDLTKKMSELSGSGNKSGISCEVQIFLEGNPLFGSISKRIVPVKIEETKDQKMISFTLSA